MRSVLKCLQYLLPLAVFILCLAAPAFAQEADDEPIAYIGHGAIFDQAGNEIVPTAEFVTRAIDYYQARLEAALPPERSADYGKLKSDFANTFTAKGADSLLVRDHLIGWLLRNVELEPDDHLLGKLGLLRRFMQHDLSNKDGQSPLTQKKAELDPEVAEKLKAFASRFPIEDHAAILSVTANSGAAYRQQCLNAGVPLPVDFGPGSPWVDRGLLPQNQLFIVSGFKASVLTMTSTSPAGMCIALPRHDGTTVFLDGIICLGKQTSKVCFWDNQDPSKPATDPAAAFQFPLGSAQPISRWVGGTDLRAAVGNVCSDCHAGENPYIIHPSTGASNPLGDLAGAGLPTMPDNWYDPFVRTGDTRPWPENPGPMNSPASCSGCHGTFDSPGFAGRLPHLSTALPSYCSTILRSAVGALAPPGPGNRPLNPPATMPAFANGRGKLACTPGLLSTDPNFRVCSAQTTVDCTPTFALNDPRRGDPKFRVSCTQELANLLSWCGQAATGDASGRGDPHLTTYNAVNYDFQSAGEFTYLRGFDGLEIQARQTPVASAGAPPANAHTGLSSCVSINTAVAARMGKHRVTYQQGSQEQGPILRIDGEPRKFGKRGISLGKSGRIVLGDDKNGIRMIFADGTTLVVSTNWWDNQKLWYMNVDVFDTSARDGVLGAIAPNNWLPMLSDGDSLGPLPAMLAQRYFDLNGKFADSWRVTDATSLFDYENGETTKDFTFPDWPPQTPDCKKTPDGVSQPSEPIDEKQAAEICSRIKNPQIRQQCIFDVSVTGNKGFVQTYLVSDGLN